MKKILYFIAGAALTFGLSACQADSGGTTQGTDKAATVTVFQYKAPTPYDVDGTTSLRVLANNKTDKFYILYEVADDKDEFIAEHGEKAYAEKVVAQGEAVIPVDGIAEIIKENLYATYAITVVPVDASGKAGIAKSVIFEGVEWVLIGAADVSYVDNYRPSAAQFGTFALTANIYYDAAKPNFFKFVSPYNVDYSIRFSYNPDSTPAANGRYAITITNPSGIEGGRPYVLSGVSELGQYAVPWAFSIDLDITYTYFNPDAGYCVFDFRIYMPGLGGFGNWYDLKYDWSAFL